MDEKRKGELAYLFLKRQMQKKGIPLNQNLKRDIGNEAKSAGINGDEAFEFTEILIRELVDDLFAE